MPLNRLISSGLIRRHFLLASLSFATATQALPARRLVFPRDFGAHKDFHTEWWYITGHAIAGRQALGFQVTFFRSRIAATQSMASGFAAQQLLFAHAAITDVKRQKLFHDQRIARINAQASLSLASASEMDTDLRLGNWSLKRAPAGGYNTNILGHDFSMDLQFNETQPVLLQGDHGLSRKGPQSEQASYYYSKPQLGVQGRLVLKGQALEINALEPRAAWLDHEWSQALMHPSAVGWDWIGMNLADGSALTAFRLRDAAGSTIWAGGSYRAGSQKGNDVTQNFKATEVVFTPVRYWSSAASQTAYPVAWRVDTPSGSYRVQALLDDQELDSRASTGAIYWEGLSELQDPQGRRLGLGYLEMTGYHSPLKL